MTEGSILAHVEFCMKAKAQMLERAKKRGGETRPATKTCPFCGGKWRFVLAGRKNHIHGSCDGECKRAITKAMETDQ